jgi:hypothetical protein
MSTVTALMIVGIWVTLQEGMIFHRVGRLLQKIPSEFIRKPLFECMICMASIHGLWIWFAFWNGGISLEVVPYLLTTCGILTVISFAIGE